MSVEIASLQRQRRALGITEPVIRDLVHTFYAQVRSDPLLGPVFESRVEDWDRHHETLVDFWSSVALMTGRYKGRPVAVHATIPDLSERHFQRWLSLFGETARACCPPLAAAFFIDRAEHIARSLQHGVRLARDGTLSPVVSQHRKLTCNES